MRPSYEKMRICEMKNRRKIKDRTFAIVTPLYYFDLKQNFESLHKE